MTMAAPSPLVIDHAHLGAVRPGAAATAAGAGKAPAREAAEQFEAVFLNTMLQSMFSGLEGGGTWDGGTGSETWRGMLVEEYSKTIVAAGGIGVADAIERELIALQERSGQ